MKDLILYFRFRALNNVLWVAALFWNSFIISKCCLDNTFLSDNYASKNLPAYSANVVCWLINLTKTDSSAFLVNLIRGMNTSFFNLIMIIEFSNKLISRVLSL